MDNRQTQISGEKVSEMSPRLRQDFFRRMAERRSNARWAGWLALGAGLLAIVFPFAASLSINALVAAVLILTGISMVWSGFSLSGWHMAGQILAGLVAILAGAWMIASPILGIVTITMLLGAVFLAEGIFQIWTALRIRPAAGWGLLVFSGVVSILVAVGIAFLLPASPVLLGVFAGINLVTTGIAMLMLAGKLDPENLREVFPDPRAPETDPVMPQAEAKQH
jgi:uncharacterized membrane protein HdeD (DUF308 family)